MSRWLLCVVAALAFTVPSASAAGKAPKVKVHVRPHGTTINSCPIFPADNVWNTPIDTLPVDPNSDNYINSIGATTSLHPDFGAGTYMPNRQPFGIPYAILTTSQRPIPIFFYYYDESDPGPWPIPSNVPIEGGRYSTGDRHIIVVDTVNCRLYEAWKAYPLFGYQLWLAGSGASWDLTSNALRPAGWTSADAAGLPIFAGLVRYDETDSGLITHAIRFTASATRNEYIWPARHKASSNSDPNLPPMGQRFRLKAGFDMTGYSRDSVAILTALKTYGMILADNGSNWYISGEPNPLWDDDVLNELKNVKGSDFEAVDTSSMIIDPNSGQAVQPGS